MFLFALVELGSFLIVAGTTNFCGRKWRATEFLSADFRRPRKIHSTSSLPAFARHQDGAGRHVSRVAPSLPRKPLPRKPLRRPCGGHASPGSRRIVSESGTIFIRSAESMTLVI